MEFQPASYLEVMVQPMSHQDPPSDEIWYFSLYSLEVWGWEENETSLEKEGFHNKYYVLEPDVTL